MNLTNEYIKKKWGERSQIELAKAIAKKMAEVAGKECGEKDYLEYKGYVNKWFKSDQEPGKHYLLILSKILNVSVESILEGRDIVYGGRPTAYSAALSGDEKVIERLFGNEERDVWLTDTDEYGKSFVDYVIEFNNYSAFKTAIKKGYGYPMKNGKLELCDRSFNDCELAKMIIGNDDEEMFKMAFGQDYASGTSAKLVFYNHSIIRTEDMKDSILKATKIMKWLNQHGGLSDIEKKAINHVDVVYPGELQPIISSVPSVFYGFNHLVNICIEQEIQASLGTMLDYGIEYVNELSGLLNDHMLSFEILKYETTCELVIRTIGSRYVLGFVPYISEYSKIKNKELQDKAIMVNEFVDKLRRK